MSDIKSKVTAVIRNYSIDRSATIGPNTTLQELGIDALDIPMIFLDLEDAVGASLTCEDEAEIFETVADVAIRVTLRLEHHRMKVSMPRARTVKRGWMSTAAEDR